MLWLPRIVPYRPWGMVDKAHRSVRYVTTTSTSFAGVGTVERYAVRLFRYGERVLIALLANRR
jgi:hypothetical protein